jgi:hypothetical protein
MQFRREDPCVKIINGRVLVGIGTALVEKIAGPQLLARPPRSNQGVANELEAESQRVCALDDTAQACAVRACM